MDYQAIKQAVSIEKAARFLDLQLKRKGETMRGDCPACEKQRVLIVTPSKNAWFCHALHKGGDAIYLVAHIKGIKQSEAAQLLQDHFMREEPKYKKPRIKKPAHSQVRGTGDYKEEYTVYQWITEIDSMIN